MISGARKAADRGRRRRPSPLPAVVALVLMAVMLPASAIELAQLMSVLAQRKSGEARFTEERFVANLDRTLHASGTVRFAAPDRFSRHTELPRAESMEVQGNQLVLKRGDRTRQMALDTVPELAALVDGLRGTLTGDAGTLTRHFEAKVGGDRRLWTLSLTPRDARLRAQVNQLEIAGSGADVRSVEVRMSGGDRSLMLLEPFGAARSP